MVGHHQVEGFTGGADRVSGPAPAFPFIAVTGKGQGRRQMAGFLEDVDHRVLDFLDVDLAQTGGPGQVLANYPGQFGRHLGIGGPGSRQGLCNGTGDRLRVEGLDPSVAFDDGGRAHVGSLPLTGPLTGPPPMTVRSSFMNSSRSLNCRYTLAKRT